MRKKIKHLKKKQQGIRLSRVDCEEWANVRFISKKLE